PSSVLRTAPMPAVNAFLTRSGTQASSFWRTDSGITESSAATAGGGVFSTSSGSGSVGVLGGRGSRSLGDMSDLGGVRAIMPCMVAPAKKEAEAVPVPVRTRSDTEELTTSSGNQMATARPPARIGRFFKAYWVTFIVIASYLSLRFQARFRSEDTIMRLLERKHRRNSRRIERAI